MIRRQNLFRPRWHIRLAALLLLAGGAPVSAQFDSLGLDCFPPVPYRANIAAAGLVGLGSVVEWHGKGIAIETTFEMIDAARGGSGFEQGKRVTATWFPRERGELCMRLGTVMRRRKELLIHATPISRAAYRYAVEAPAFNADARTQLSYFARFFASPHEDIAADVQIELDRFPFHNLMELADVLTAARFLSARTTFAMRTPNWPEKATT